jgi:hypothetical protein
MLADMFVLQGVKKINKYLQKFERKWIFYFSALL